MTQDNQQLPFSQAAANNAQPILEVLQQHIPHDQKRSLIEIGAGTGQHGEFLAKFFPNLSWRSTDLAENLPHIEQRQRLTQLDNIQSPLELNAAGDWVHIPPADIIFTANTFHIMSWSDVLRSIKNIGQHLRADGLLFVYGPFNYDGQFTSPSNAQFDVWLKQRGAHQGIRDFEEVVAKATAHGLSLQHDHAMPANNRCLVFHKTPA